MNNIGKFLLTGAAIFFLFSAFSQSNRLWYDKPSQKWTDALPIGNGRIGAMVFGGVEEDRIQFNEESLWTGEPREYNRMGAAVHLDKIRQLLFEGKQKEANALAEKEFMGLKSAGGNREQWINEMFALKGIAGDPSKKTFDDGQWKQIRVPHFEGWETVGLDGLDGAVWFTKTFVVTAATLNKPLILDLNRIRDQDRTYVNGVLVGQTASGDARRYAIPANLLVEGENRIAIQVLNFSDKGGLSGYKDTARHIGFLVGPSDPAPLIDLQGSWKYFVQNDEPPAIPMYQADYQPFGDLVMQFNHAGFSNYTRELDITNALAKTSYTHAGIKFTRTYFSSAVDQVVGIELDADKAKNIDVSFAMKSPHGNYHTTILNDSTMRLHVAVKHGALFGESILRLRVRGGRVFSKNGMLHVEDADQVFAYWSAATNFKKYNDISADPLALSTKAIEAIESTSSQTIKANHLKEYKKYFDRFSIDFGKNAQDAKPTDQRIREFGATGDPSLLSLYVQYSRYLLISSSRPGTMPANLQGIWNDLLAPPWGSKYTTNINTEMNYWPAEPLNLSDLHDPLFKMIEEVAERGAVTAKEYYNAPGWVLHHNTDLWRGTAAINAANHGIWVTGGAWLSHHFWEHYLFTSDKSFLQKRGYPVMKGAAAFFKHFLVKDPNTGWLISSPSNSPEQGGLVAGPAMDHQIIRSLFKAVISAADILQTDKAFADSLRMMLPQIAPDQVGKHGQLQEWMQDVDDPSNKHRHVSHLWGVYPGTEIVWGKNEKFMNAAKQSLLFRGDAATGWSLGWKINLWARFRDGDHVYTLLKMLLSPAETGGAGSYVNLFDAHPPFQIDGNFGGAAGIGEMLVQSHDDQIVLLPALPSALPEGSVKGICARGGFELKMDWKNSMLVAVELISKAGNECAITYQGKSIRFKTIKGKKYVLDGNLELQEPSFQAVSEEKMKEIYKEIKTPYKYGMVLTPKNDSFKVDCPTIFRKKSTWYMSYIVFDGKGYETWLAQSKDLLQWETMGRLLSFPKDSTAWNASQLAGYFSLYDTRWGGAYKLGKHDGRSWMSYIGGKSSGYEAGELSIGMASTKEDPSKAHEWTTYATPVLSSKDAGVRWWENRKEFKSTVIVDKQKSLGAKYVMYYNANGDTAKDNKKTRWYERIGMALSDDMLHWRRFKTEPVVHHEEGITGDPYLQKIGDVWVMFYFGAFWKDRPKAFDRFACSYDLVNWTDWEGESLIEPSEPFDARYAHKPCVIKHKGIVYHFYNAVNEKDQRGIAVATSKDLGKSSLHFNVAKK